MLDRLTIRNTAAKKNKLGPNTAVFLRARFNLYFL
jgi:hypothetical protein